MSYDELVRQLRTLPLAEAMALAARLRPRDPDLKRLADDERVPTFMRGAFRTLLVGPRKPTLPTDC